MSLTFADISSHNTVSSWPAFLGSVDGVAVKATQGSTYVWAGAPAALANIRGAGKLTGAYAFAGDLGSDGKVRCGDPVAEADYFLSHYTWQPGEVPILDFEPSILPADPDSWCATFCARVDSRIGVVPWTYMNSSTAKSGPWTKTRAAGSLLWVAQYNANTGQPGTAPTVGSWGSFVAWQYTSNGRRPGISSPLDLSLFYGDAAAWKAHGTPGADMPLTSQEIAAVAQAVWSYNIAGKGTQAQDRLYGIDAVQLPALAKAVAASPAALDPKVLAAAIVAALPAAQAQQVVDELGKRLNTPAA